MAHFGDSLLLQADVDAVVFRDACHVSLQTVAYVDAAEELVAVDHAPVTVVHDHPIADRGFRSHEQRNLFAGLYRDNVVIDVAFEFHGRHAAPRYRIYIQVNQAVPSGQHASLLVAVGQEQVFARESPVEECAVQVLVHYAQESRFSFAQLRRFGRGDQSVFRIVIDEYFERIADLVGQRNITVGQQYFVLFVVDQIESVVRDAVYGEGLCASCFEHNGCFILTKVRFIFAESNF